MGLSSRAPAWVLFAAFAVALRPETRYRRKVQSRKKGGSHIDYTWTSSSANNVCRDDKNCGENHDERCRDTFCSKCSTGFNCTSLAEAKACCVENELCSAVYGGGEHWWTFEGEACEEKEHENTYKVYHIGMPDLDTGMSGQADPDIGMSGQAAPMGRFPIDLLSCSDPPVKRTHCLDDEAMNSLNIEIRQHVAEHFGNLDEQCDKAACHRGDLAGCIVRFVGHDIMDYQVDDDGRESGGADGCMDFEDADNTGLHECLLMAVEDPDGANVSLESMWQEFCGRVSAADFFVIAAEVLMVETLPQDFKADWEARFQNSFRFGRLLQEVCFPPPLPNPTESCAATEENFVQQLKLDWESATALMGVHTLGRAMPKNSGFDGFWTSGDHAKTFSNQYFKAIVNVGWKSQVVPESGKTQWVRADDTLPGEMMLNTDMCLAFQAGEKEPYTRSEELLDCCLWFEEIKGIETGCNRSGELVNNLDNCCGELPTCGPNLDAKLEVELLARRTESLPAVLKFARSQSVWLDKFIDVWHQVTQQGMNLC